MANVVVSGDTSGAITIAAPAVAGTNTLTLPASTGTLVATGGAQTIEFAAGTVSAPSITTTGDTNTGVFFPAADTIAFAEGGAEAMRITSGGDLCVNRTSTLGSVKFVVESDTTTYNPMTVSNTRSTAATDYQIIMYRNGSIVGSIQTSLSATSYVTSSDYRLKENIAPMVGALNLVQKLKPVTYDWISTKEKGQGFIAHELQEVIPDAVTGEKDAVDADGNIKPQGVDTSFLVATLTAAIQEQQQIINDLKARIETLENK